MSDKELLEFAAKAAGNAPTGISYLALLRLGQWNPREDDGDALRLAVKLKLDILQRDEEPAKTWWTDGEGTLCSEEVGNHYAATRRAIVRAAAEIGKSMA